MKQKVSILLTLKILEPNLSVWYNPFDQKFHSCCSGWQTTFFKSRFSEIFRRMQPTLWSAVPCGVSSTSLCSWGKYCWLPGVYWSFRVKYVAVHRQFHFGWGCGNIQPGILSVVFPQKWVFSQDDTIFICFVLVVSLHHNHQNVKVRIASIPESFFFWINW